LEIDIVGVNNYQGERIGERVIYHINNRKLSQPLPSSIITNYPYLIACEKIDELSCSYSHTSTIDIFGVRDFNRINSDLKKKVKKGIGLEVTLVNLRKLDGLQIGKWFSKIRDLYKLCKSSNCQFILSSGANSALEMVSGPSFDSILEICDIKPEYYWQELAEWLESKCHIRCL
jgi:RNase P/RNase MRP subunit p30